jgi:NAD dependent epimerase/dehydratase family enzyme
MAIMLLTGVEVSASKILKNEFEFRYPFLSDALTHILTHKKL